MPHAGAPEAENFPARQITQLEDNTAPNVLKYFPLGQFVQAPLPVLIAYWPAAQLKHELELRVEYCPPGQPTQLVDPVFDWYLPAVQETQEDAPVAEYLPVGQGMQMEDIVPPVVAR